MRLTTLSSVNISLSRIQWTHTWRGLLELILHPGESVAKRRFRRGRRVRPELGGGLVVTERLLELEAFLATRTTHFFRDNALVEDVRGVRGLLALFHLLHPFHDISLLHTVLLACLKEHFVL